MAEEIASVPSFAFEDLRDDTCFLSRIASGVAWRASGRDHAPSRGAPTVHLASRGGNRLRQCVWYLFGYFLTILVDFRSLFGSFWTTFWLLFGPCCPPGTLLGPPEPTRPFF